MIESLRQRARLLKRETLTLYFAVRDPRTPWFARVVAAAVVAYALSPFDLIPDFIPVVGYLDDLIIIPAGIALVLRMVPAGVLADCRERATNQELRQASVIGAVFIITVWIALAFWAFLFVRNLFAS
jgi:uncharacterized membrane protein YkvA (DUF1232 family)